MTKQHTKKRLDTAINGGDETPRTVIFMKKPDGSLIFYGSWPPHPTLRPGDEVPSDEVPEEEDPQRLSVIADSPETADVFLKLRGERPVIPGNVI